MSEDYDDITNGSISVDRAKHHCGRLAVDCGWRAMEVEMHIDAQAKRIAELEEANAELRAANDELRKQNHILDLSVQLEEDLQNRAYDLLARMHLPQGWSVVEVAKLIIDMQKRIAADWVKVGNLMNKAYPPFSI